MKLIAAYCVKCDRKQITVVHVQVGSVCALHCRKCKGPLVKEEENGR